MGRDPNRRAFYAVLAAIAGLTVLVTLAAYLLALDINADALNAFSRWAAPLLRRFVKNNPLDVV